MKKWLKYLIGYIKCKIYKVGKYESKIYIGKNVNIFNGKNITIKSEVQIRPNVDLFASEKIIIGEGTDIGTRNRFDGNIIIERKCLFGPDNYISSRGHKFENINIPIIMQGAENISRNGHDEIIIGEGSWIGTHVAIIGDVHIGKHCVIGANSVVTKDIPDYSVVVGNPARVIKKYDFNKKEWIKI